MKVLITANLLDDNKQKLEREFKDIHFVYHKQNELTQEIADDCDVIVGTPRNVNLNRESLKALLLNSAGSDYYVKEGLLHPSTKLTNASGSYGKAIAEHTIGMMIVLNKGFIDYIDAMKEGKWIKTLHNKEIYHSTVVIVGLGDLGYELARRLKAFDCTVIGVKRRVSELPEHIDELYTMDSFKDVLPRADYVISALPHSPSTTHIFNKETLYLMKKDAMLINIGRGSAIKTDDLVEVLNNDHLYGCALDVLEQEPLDPSHPLWKMNNVFITPHISGGFKWHSVREYFTDLVIRNLHHLLNDEALENEVDFITGYRKEIKYK